MSHPDLLKRMQPDTPADRLAAIRAIASTLIEEDTRIRLMPRFVLRGLIDIQELTHE